MTVAIDVQELCKKYGPKTAVHPLSLTVQQGEIFALLGVNGAGKTTLINMLSSLTKPTEGEAFLLGNSVITDKQKVKQCIAVSPQETAIAPNLSVRENLLLMAGVHGFNKETAKLKVNEMLALFSLSPVEKQRSKTLSGGWQRRLSIAMALISEPEILFLDEPTLGLDILARRELWAIIQNLKGRVTLILTTHYLEEAEALADHICIMKNGRIEALGTIEELKEQTATERFEEAFVQIVGGMM
ncbi:ABC transporter ATP-binding protein [Bacillus ndiopicus]|uniref:ABC transporter ATP-binding protein n=1 Tax=Bacillus ndiopicus TaxID=1347368 RepID=UPI0005A83BC7|nr:ABC transporter ATP-binding protein [Bacillus ndiopicus]